MTTEDEIARQLRPKVSTAVLNAVTKKAMHARDIELEISNLEQRLKERKAELRDIYQIDLPNLMDQAQTDRIGIPANGNLPAYDLFLVPYFNANIAASWPQEKRAAAFAALTELGHEDLIKTEITISFPRAERTEAQMAVATLLKLGYHPNIKESVHHKTLSAWLEEQFKYGNALPPLETIGAEVGRVVKLTERK